MLSGSSPIVALSNHTICSQNQTGATVPLNQAIVFLYTYAPILDKEYSLCLLCDVEVPLGHHVPVRGRIRPGGGLQEVRPLRLGGR
jgi:hypothetical protein